MEEGLGKNISRYRIELHAHPFLASQVRVAIDSQNRVHSQRLAELLGLDSIPSITQGYLFVTELRRAKGHKRGSCDIAFSTIKPY